MAGDWIKMRTDLYRDPKVCVIADALLDGKSDLACYVSQNLQRDMSVTRNVMRNVTVGALVSVWGVLRHRGKRIDDDLVVKGCGLSVVDDLSDLPGFGDAMASVGWIVESDQGLVFPRFFEEFNVDPSDESKAKNAERQRRWREKKKAESNVTADVSVASQSNAREEKRREEKDKGFAPPDWVASDAWSGFEEMRKRLKKPMTDRARKLLVADLTKLRDKGHNPNDLLDTATKNGWLGVWEPKGPIKPVNDDPYDLRRAA